MATGTNITKTRPPTKMARAKTIESNCTSTEAKVTNKGYIGHPMGQSKSISSGQQGTGQPTKVTEDKFFSCSFFAEDFMPNTFY